MSDYLINAMQYIYGAVSSGQIARTQYNCIRRCWRLFDEEQRAQWFALCGGVFNRAIAIVEDGDLVVDVALSLDADNRVIGVLS